MTEPTKLEKAIDRHREVAIAWADRPPEDIEASDGFDWSLAAVIEAAREEAKHPTCASCRWYGLGDKNWCRRYHLYKMPTWYCADHDPKEASDEG